MSQVIRLADLPDRQAGARAPLWWGMLLLITIEAMVIASLLASYIYLRLAHDAWPPAGVDPPDLLLPVVNTGLLVAGALAVLVGMRAAKRGDQGGLKLWLSAGVGLGLVGLVIKFVESSDFGTGWQTHAYWSIYWTINGMHGVHNLAAVFMGSAALLLAFRGYYTPERRVGIQAVSLYWQFVAVASLPVLLVVYFLPRWI